MNNIQKERIIIDSPRVIKLLKKQLIKKILDCFTDSPKTAAEISRTVSFPKDKIYYHIKNLIANNILYVADVESIKGIEQKKFFPTAKTFELSSLNEAKETLKSIKSIKKETLLIEKPKHIRSTRLMETKSKPRNLIRRRKKERRLQEKRISNIRRHTNNNIFKGRDKRKVLEQRTNLDRRILNIRREMYDRRFSDELIYKRIEKTQVTKFKETNNNISIPFKNSILKMKGIDEAISFVYDSQSVTVLHCHLTRNGFEIHSVNKYELPIVIKDYTIDTLPDLITNIISQIVPEKNKSKIYISIHSEKYNYEMAYILSKGKNRNLFKKELYKTFNNNFSLNLEDTLTDFTDGSNRNGKATILYSNKKDLIFNDLQSLKESGLEAKYNTSIPKILYNIYTYYNLDQKNDHSVLIYIGALKTHIVVLKKQVIIGSSDFPKGLNYFSKRLSEISTKKSSVKELIRDALHYLSFYGVAIETSNAKIIDGFSFVKAKSIVSHLVSTFQGELIESLNLIYPTTDLTDLKESLFSRAYICGPGSHIKNIELSISSSLKCDVSNLADFNSSQIKEAQISKKSYFNKIKKSQFFKKRTNSEIELESIKNKIQERQLAIETAKSPESAKYRLARLEIEKNTKTKSIENATNTLIATAKEFKEIKSEFTSNQEILSTDLQLVTAQLDEQSELLLSDYQEHDDLKLKISEVEYETDKKSSKNSDSKLVSKSQYQSKIKVAANSRSKLLDQKEKDEAKADEIDQSILERQDSLQLLNIKLDSGENEIAVYEYLKDSIQSTANAFKRSFIDHAKSLEKVSEKDLNTLIESSFLITQNTNRINSIKESFTSVIEGEIDIKTSHFIDGENGVEIRKRLMDILELVLNVPDAVNELKTYISTTIKINEEQIKLGVEKRSIDDNIKRIKRNKKELKQSYSIINNELNNSEKDLTTRENRRLDLIQILAFIRETIEIINDINYQTSLLKELRPQIKFGKEEIKTLDLNISSLKDKVELHENENHRLTTQIKKFEEKSISDLEDSNKDLKKIILDEEKIIDEIEDQNHKIKEVSKEVLSAQDYVDQLEKNIVTKKSEIEDLNENKVSVLENYSKEEKLLNNEFDKRLRVLKRKKNQKIAESEKTKNETIKIFFQKEEKTLKKKEKLINSNLIQLNREKNKAILDKEKVDKTLAEKKKKKLPEISKLKQQILSLRKDLKRGRKVEEKLIILEDNKNKWDDLYEDESTVYQNKIDILQKSIDRKKSTSYIEFVREGLSRFNKNGDPLEIAQSMADESIKLDLEEIKKEESAYMLFRDRYDSFMKRYRKRSREITEQLRPLGGREKVIRNKIKTAEAKIESAEKIIKSLIDKLEQKNNFFVGKNNALKDYIDQGDQDLENIKIQISKIPEKESRAIYDIDLKTAGKIAAIEKEEAQLKKEYDTLLDYLNDQFQSETVIKQTQQIENKILNEFQDLDKTKATINSLEEEIVNLKQSRTSLENKLKRQIKKIEKSRIDIQNQGIQSNAREDELNREKDFNTQGLLKKQSVLIEEVNKRDDLQEKLSKQNEEFQKADTIIKTLKEKVSKSITENKNEFLLNSSLKKKNKKLNSNEQLEYLLQIEKDLLRNIEQAENLIFSANTIIDNKRVEGTDTESTLSLKDNDLGYLENDRKKIELLIESNLKYLNDIKNDYLKNLNLISNVKDLYPPVKLMIVERISVLHTLVDQKLKDSQDLSFQIDELKESLKNTKVEIAIVDEELSKINNNMKQALENSFYDKENQEETWKWDVLDDKVGSYVNIAQLKTRSKELFNEIVSTEESVAILKHKESSLNNVISESEKLSKKKIKRMEDVCIKLELQITKEKNEITGIEKEVHELKSLAFNYGDRIKILEKELKQYREKEAEYEITLKDLDRSINTIKERSDKLIEKSSAFIENTIDLDYMANLGLLMDPFSELNLLPETQKENLNYFFTNRVMQNVLAILFMVLTISSFFQFNQIKPIDNQIPIKQAELSLINMRQDIKEVVQSKNLVANKYSSLINDDSEVSSEMILILKYFSNKVPKGFHITELTLDKLQSNHLSTASAKSLESEVLINLNGFFNKSLDRSLLMAENFKNDLKSSGHFRKIEFNEAENQKKYRTSFTISVIY